MIVETKTVTVDGMEVVIDNDRNLLELIRRAGVEIPTFCYHSDLSIYGACRLCLVDVEGRGIMASCSTKPEAGMKIRTNTAEIREIRKVTLELLLANHNRECPTCSRSSNCSLQDLARRLGVDTIRFKQLEEMKPIDKSSYSIQRDPNKCVLCGDCVRVCHEVQGIGAIDFANRGSTACVAPAFQRDLNAGECVNCGQCAAVCPTGALIPHQEREDVWKAIENPKKTVVAQIAPAVRVALGEYFGMEPGAVVTGQMVAALKRLGFDEVYDTVFTADLTIFEEANEFLGRYTKGEKLPLFTSCCPGWVKFAETYFPDFLPNLSSCKSPQQMFGSLAKKVLPAQLGVAKEDLVVVSIMPCTAKKTEAKLDKFKTDGQPDVDHVLTTQEIGRMIRAAGIQFDELEPEAFDMPLGFGTGAGVIFGSTGGVMEAALRYVVEKVENKPLTKVEFKAVRGLESLREAELDVAGNKVRVAVVHGLKNARDLCERIRAGEVHYDFIEVMACPGGCIAGAGQPIAHDRNIRQRRMQSIYNVDKSMQVQKSQDNHFVVDTYKEHLGEVGGHEAHHLLHTVYEQHNQFFDARVPILVDATENDLPVTVTIGANGSAETGQKVLASLVDYVKGNKLTNKVNLYAAFSPRSLKGNTTTVTVGEHTLSACDADEALTAIKKAIK